MSQAFEASESGRHWVLRGLVVPRELAEGTAAEADRGRTYKMSEVQRG